MLSNIKATNFLSWKDLEFDVSRGVTLIDGWNEDDQRSEGSGKSAILNAICWCLFGCLPKEANIDDVIKDNETSCQVILEFDNGDTIVRTRKPNDLYMTKAGAIIKGKDSNETKSLIEEYIGLNFETFCQSIYFAQNYDKKFLMAKQAEKGKILSSIQNLQIFDKARKEALDLASIEDKKITQLKNQVQVMETNVSGLQTQKNMLQGFIADKIQKHQSQVNMIVQQRDLVAGHILNSESQMESVKVKIAAINMTALDNDEQELTAARTTYSQQLGQVAYQKKEIDSIKRSILLKEQEGKNIATKYEGLVNKKNSIANMESHPTFLRLKADHKRQSETGTSPSFIRLLTKETELKAFIANPTKNCPSCGTELKNIDTSHVQKELDGVVSEMQLIANHAQVEIKRIEDDMVLFGNQFQVEHASLDTEMANYLKQLEDISEYLNQNPMPSLEALNSQEAEIQDVVNQINKALSETQAKKSEASQLSNQYVAASNQYNNYVQQKNQLDQSLETLGTPDVSQDQAKLSQTDIQIGTLLEQLTELKNLLETSKAYYARLESLKEGFKEIKSFVFTNALNELNYRVNEYLSELFEVEATIRFSNEDQTIEQKITLDGKERSLGLLSGGQSRRFNLAVDLALSDIVSSRKTSKLDMLIFDEYFKDLSEISMEKCLDLLKSRKCPVVLIEHNSIFKNVIDNTFFVRLQNGTSRHGT